MHAHRLRDCPTAVAGGQALERFALLVICELDKPHLDLTTPLGRGFIAFLSAMAEDERQRILARCNAGRQVAIAKGVRFGPKPKPRRADQGAPVTSSRSTPTAKRNPSK